jgi:spore maturation protein CgeB
MKIVIFGLTISSSWGNGHATLWRGLCKALAAMGHRVVFFERDVPYYAAARDYPLLPSGELVLYEQWQLVSARAERELADADAAIVTSYCPDALQATDAMLDRPRLLSVFYDLDTPVTLAAIRSQGHVGYIGERGLRDFDLVLSYTGGAVGEELASALGASFVRTLYGHVDPDAHRAVAPVDRYRADLSWLGTYAADRQQKLERLFVEPARQRGGQKFLIGGAQYPTDFPWVDNVYFVSHVPPQQHSAFFSSARLTLNLTRDSMAHMGWCPSGRLFEAAACAATILSDDWCGLQDFYTAGSELLLTHRPEDTLRALDLEDHVLRRIGQAARERTLDEHTSRHRACQLLSCMEAARSPDRSSLAPAWRKPELSFTTALRS